MKQVVMITNQPKDEKLKTTAYIQQFLERRGIGCQVFTDARTDREFQILLKKAAEKADAVLVLGGDGTLLRAAGDIADSKTPLLGVNLGTLGFLAEVEKSALPEALERLISGNYSIEERMMLHGQIIREGMVLEDRHSLNDIVISRSGPLQMIDYQISVNGRYLKRYHADGMIVSTPTGSTGYNMSAGGPIVEPGARLLLLTPICPHTLQTRSIILSEEDMVEIMIQQRVGASVPQVEASFDGSRSIPLKPGDCVRIQKSEKVTSIIKMSEAGFLDVLHRKMSE